MKKLCILLFGGALLAGCGGDEAEVNSESVSADASNVATVELAAAEPAVDDAPPPPPVAPGSLPQGMVAVAQPMQQQSVELNIPASSPQQVETDLQDLNSAVDQYIADKKTAPSVNSLLNSGYIEKLPIAPEGKHYIFDKSQNRFVLKDA